MKSKTKKLKILPGLQKWTKKTASALLSAGMALSVFTSPSTVMADESTSPTTETANDESYNSDINPKFTIQHYLNFPSLAMYKVRDENEKLIAPKVSGFPDDCIGLDIYNTAKQYSTDGKIKTPTNTEMKPRYQIAIAGKDKVQPFIAEGDKTSFDEGEVITRNEYKALFQDEKVNYLERPQIQYMNRLFNSTTGESTAYNANYTLSEVWVIKNKEQYKKDKEELSSDEFEKKYANKTYTNGNDKPEYLFLSMNVPYLIQDGQNGKEIPKTEGGTQRHNPSRIRFTNNPKTIDDLIDEDSANALKNSEGKSVAAQKTIATYQIDGENVLDYEWYILVEEDSVIRFVFDPTEQDNYINQNGVNFYDYDISDGQHPAEEDTMNTYQAGINSDGNYRGEGAKLAFGNSNAGTSRHDEKWDGNGKSANTLNKFNNGVYAGMTFGLASGLNAKDKYHSMVGRGGGPKAVWRYS